MAVANPPEAMARQLTLGAKLDAVIAGAAAKGQFQIATAFGRVVIQTNLPLPWKAPCNCSCWLRAASCNS